MARRQGALAPMAAHSVVVVGQAEREGEEAVLGTVEGASGGALDLPGHDGCPFSSGCAIHRTGLAATPLAASRAAIPTQVVTPLQPATVAADYAMVTRSHRRLYWSVAPATLHQPVLAHATLGCALLPETAGQTRTAVAAALAETFMLAGRIEFFDLREPEPAAQTLLRALQAAAEADEPLLGAAILAHTAFIPGWDGRRDEDVERMTAARTYARRGPASAELLAWLDAVEAECETRCGNFRTALHPIGPAEDTLA